MTTVSTALATTQVVIPQRLREHLEHHAGTHHATLKSSRASASPRCIMNLPLSISFLQSGPVCQTCKANGDQGYYYRTTDADVQAWFPDVLAFRGYGTLFMTRAFLLDLVQQFYEYLNTRACRRGLIHSYCTNALAFQAGSTGFALLSSVRRTIILRDVLCRALES